MGQGDLRQVLTAVAVVAEASNRRELVEGVLALVVAVAGADSAAVTRLDASGAAMTGWPDGFLLTEHHAAFEELHHVQPWPLASHTHDGDGRPLRISDLFSQRQYRGLSIYAELFRLMEIEHQVAFAVRVDSQERMCVVAHRQGRDFSAADLERLEALRPTLAASAARVARLERPAPVPGASRFASVSSRESEVLALVAKGLTNDQIGRGLGISTRTVNKHLEHIYARAGTRNRTEAAVRWLEAERPACSHPADEPGRALR